MSAQYQNTLCVCVGGKCVCGCVCVCVCVNSVCENVYEAEEKKNSVIYCCTHGSHLQQDSVIYCCLFSSMQKIPSGEVASQMVTTQQQ